MRLALLVLLLLAALARGQWWDDGEDGDVEPDQGDWIVDEPSFEPETEPTPIQRNPFGGAVKLGSTGFRASRPKQGAFASGGGNVGVGGPGRRNNQNA